MERTRRVAQPPPGIIANKEQAVAYLVELLEKMEGKKEKKELGNLDGEELDKKELEELLLCEKEDKSKTVVKIVDLANRIYSIWRNLSKECFEYILKSNFIYTAVDLMIEAKEIDENSIIVFNHLNREIVKNLSIKYNKLTFVYCTLRPFYRLGEYIDVDKEGIINNNIDMFKSIFNSSDDLGMWALAHECLAGGDLFQFCTFDRFHDLSNLFKLSEVSIHKAEGGRIVNTGRFNLDSFEENIKCSVLVTNSLMRPNFSLKWVYDFNTYFKKTNTGFEICGPTDLNRGIKRNRENDSKTVAVLKKSRSETSNSNYTPRPTPHPIPRTTPRPIPRTTPRPIPRTTPRPIPRTTPRPIPRTTPRPIPRTTPRPIPRTTLPAKVSVLKGENIDYSRFKLKTGKLNTL